MKYPKKNLFSYLLPFVLIIILGASGWYILKNRINIQEVSRFFKAPEIAKDEKVKLVFQEGQNQIKPWSDKLWKSLKTNAFLQVGDILKTGDGSSIVLRFFDKSEIRLAANSQMKLIQLDKDIDGNALAVELTRGQMWKRGSSPSGEKGESSEFIINTQNQVIQINEKAVIDVSATLEGIRVISGDARVNIAVKKNDTRIPVARLTLTAGQELIIDPLVIDQLKTGDKEGIVTSISAEYMGSQWYAWNIDKEQKLGFHIATPASLEDKEPSEELAEGLVKVTSHKSDQAVSANILLQGVYNTEKIDKIWVNGQAATLGIEGEWESPITLSEQRNIVTVSAQELGSETRKTATKLKLNVDTTGPVIGKIIQPELDENDNGIQKGDTLELIGEISTDATQVCVSHNGTSPAYCLKQFSAGDSTYRYLGGVQYGNVVSGKNEYRITAKDALNNESSKTIFLFKDIAKPSERLEGSTTSTTTTNTSATNSKQVLMKPIIKSPDISDTIKTSDPKLKISGTVDPASQSLLINDKITSYTPGSSEFEVSLALTEGENSFTIHTMDRYGHKSKKVLIKVIYFEKVKKDME